MVMAQPFTTASPLIASFDWTDIQSGTGTDTFLLYQTETSAGTDHHLSPNTVYSSALSEQIGPVDGALAKASDIDYDLTEYQISQEIEGVGHLEIPIAYEITNAAGTGSFYMIAKLRKWDGTTETEVASVQSETISSTAGVTDETVWSMPITIPYTHFAQGDTLRLTIETWATSDGTEEIYLAYGIDPINREVIFHTETMQTSISKLSVPFKLNL